MYKEAHPPMNPTLKMYTIAVRTNDRAMRVANATTNTNINSPTRYIFTYINILSIHNSSTSHGARSRQVHRQSESIGRLVFRSTGTIHTQWTGVFRQHTLVLLFVNCI